MDRCQGKLSDEQLCAACAESGEALETLVTRYSNLVRACARPYFLAGADSDDLLQEGMLGLLHAVSAFDPKREASFKSFAAVCIRSRLISAVRAADSGNNRLMNHAVSLCTFSPSSQPSEINLPPTEKSPEELLIGREEFAEFLTRLDAVLSPLEKQTLELYLKGLSYREIADSLQKSPKSVDNAVQRIRAKVSRQSPQASTAESRSQYSNPV